VFEDADHTKLNAIEANATTDQTAAEIRALVASASDSQVFTDADHTKLNGIATSANAYSHPTGNGNNHIPSGGASGQILQYSSAGTAAWGAAPGASTTYGAVGTYAAATYNIGTSTIMGGGTVAGSTLYYYWQPDNTYADARPLTDAATNSQNVSSGFSGTWRLMAGRMTGYASAGKYYSGLWVRIS
jgi:hypothetical protein